MAIVAALILRFRFGLRGYRISRQDASAGQIVYFAKDKVFGDVSRIAAVASHPRKPLKACVRISRK